MNLDDLAAQVTALKCGETIVVEMREPITETQMMQLSADIVGLAKKSILIHQLSEKELAIVAAE